MSELPTCPICGSSVAGNYCTECMPRKAEDGDDERPPAERRRPARRRRDPASRRGGRVRPDRPRRGRLHARGPSHLEPPRAAALAPASGGRPRHRRARLEWLPDRDRCGDRRRDRRLARRRRAGAGRDEGPRADRHRLAIDHRVAARADRVPARAGRAGGPAITPRRSSASTSPTSASVASARSRPPSAPPSAR